MLKRLLPLLILTSVLAALACGAPPKVTQQWLPPCEGSGRADLDGLPFTRQDKAACARAIEPFDVSVWLETPYNSRKIRGRETVLLGCRPITTASDTCDTCGLPGQSASALFNFDPSVFPDDTEVRRVILALYSPDNAQRLAEAQLRGRLNVGDEMQSLGSPREAVTAGDSARGWVFFDISVFGARAISERRNSIHFELSVPCQTPAENLVTVDMGNRNEARLIVEYY